MERLLTVKEVAEILHCHHQTIYRNRDLPSIAVKGVGIRFKKSDLDEYLEKKAIKRAQEIRHVINDQDFILKKPLVCSKVKTGGISELAKAKSKTRYNLGFGAIYQRKTKGKNIRWYLDYRDQGGKRVQKIAPRAVSREDAVIALRAEVLKTFNCEYRVACEKGDISFEEFSEIYRNNYMTVERKNWKSDSYRLKKLEGFFKKVRLSEVNPEKIRRLKKTRLDKGNSERTVNRYLALLKRIFSVAISDGYVRDNPVKQVKFFSENDTRRDRVLGEEEEKKFLSECSERLRPVVLTAIHTGMRIGEILSLDWRHVDLTSREILVERTKGKNARSIPINQFLFELLSNLKRANGRSDLVFPVKSIRTAFENACARAGLEDFTFHDLRRTFGTRLLERGTDIVTIQKLYGHSNPLVTQLYLHPSDELKKEAVELLVADSAQSLEKGKNCGVFVTRREAQVRKELPIN